MTALGFVVAERTEPVPVEEIVQALERFSVPGTTSTEGDGHIVHELPGGGQLLVSFMPNPYPTIDRAWSEAPMSPSQDELVATRSHFIVVVMGTPLPAAGQDLVLLRACAAVVEASSGVAARIGGGLNWIRADIIVESARSIGDDEEPPALLVIGLSVGAEPDGSFSLLTDGLVRYDREEILLKADPDGSGALSLIWDLAEWLMRDPGKHFPTGDTIGRTPEERLLVERVPSPVDDQATVMLIDQRPSAPPAKGSRLFRRRRD